MGTSIDLTKKVYIFLIKMQSMQKTLILMQKKKRVKVKKKKTKTKTKEGRGSCLNRPRPVGMVVTMI